jgi:hypothetical protein
MRLKGNIAPGKGSGAFFTGQRLSPLAIRFINESYLAVSSVAFNVVSFSVVWADAVRVEAMEIAIKVRKMFFKCSVIWLLQITVFMPMGLKENVVFF